MVDQSEGMQRLEIGSAQQFAANTTQQAPVNPQSKGRRAPTKKKTRVIVSDSDEAEFQMRMRGAKLCLDDASTSDGTSGSESSDTLESSTDDDEVAFQCRCAVRAAANDEQREAIELRHEAEELGLTMTGKRSRRQARTKLELAVEATLRSVRRCLQMLDLRLTRHWLRQSQTATEALTGQVATSMVKAIANAVVSIVTCQQTRGKAISPCALSVRERLWM